GAEFLSCKDNGVGMNKDIIVDFLTRVGRSFYRSPYFERERIRFRQKRVEFDPCSQFGIGFMSCFMLGDRIDIETRRDHGPGHALGEPWLVEINGLGSIVTLRPGTKETQAVGTKALITCRPRSEKADREAPGDPVSPPGMAGPVPVEEASRDVVELMTTLRKSARAVEYP